jgi:hypothetical protein
MATGSNVKALPVKRVRPAAKPAARKAAAKKPRVKKVARAPAKAVKASGYAVGVSKLHYDWITATAEALGKSRQAVADGIIAQLLQRATLGSQRRKARR